MEQAKQFMYNKYDIKISYTSVRELNVTNETNMYKDIEYNELIGKYVYGWDLNGNSLYEPTLGVSIIAPEYINSGTEWRTVLDQRYSKLDQSDRECKLENYTGN